MIRPVRTGKLYYTDREQLALVKGNLIHPQYKQEFEKSFSISWHKTKYNLGGWAIYSAEERQTLYKALIKTGEAGLFRRRNILPI